VPEPFNPQSLNRYSYVMNDPVNRIDPTGLTSLFGLQFSFTGASAHSGAIYGTDYGYDVFVGSGTYYSAGSAPSAPYGEDRPQAQAPSGITAEPFTFAQTVPMQPGGGGSQSEQRDSLQGTLDRLSSLSARTGFDASLSFAGGLVAPGGVPIGGRFSLQATSEGQFIEVSGPFGVGSSTQFVLGKQAPIAFDTGLPDVFGLKFTANLGAGAVGLGGVWQVGTGGVTISGRGGAGLGTSGTAGLYLRIPVNPLGPVPATPDPITGASIQWYVTGP
jgi:hypothetical protein